MSQPENENQKEMLSNNTTPEKNAGEQENAKVESQKEENAAEESFSESVENPTANQNEETELKEETVAESTFVHENEEPANTDASQDSEETEDEDDEVIDEHKKGVDDSLAEDSEDETTSERYNIPKKDYHSMSKEDLVAELEKLLKNEKVQAIKEHVIEIRTEFNAKFDEEVEEKKEEFLAEGGNIIDFQYTTPLKKQFNSLYFDYREKRNNYYQQLNKDLNANLNRRFELIEELKGLINVEENINTTYNHFKEIQDQWRTAGPIPRDKYSTVWNTYHHHVENFYDFLHLNREFRDMDFKHNLDQKIKLINRAEELTQETDVNRSFRELQMLHKIWKEELGPVAKEYRDEIWDRFSKATKLIHDRRQDYFNNLEQEFEKNWEKKQQIIEKIREIADQTFTSHNKWQQKIKEVESLREAFFKAGKVPRTKNEDTWSDFKAVVRQFNRNKNTFYKNLKKDQYKNLEKKKELIQIAEDNKESDDFKTVTPLMKKIQADWKSIGHVPRKDSDKIWKQFKEACNFYFNKLNQERSESEKVELDAYGAKKDLLDKVRSYKLTGEKEEDLKTIKGFISEWKNIGRVPYNKRFIEGKFNKALDQLFNKLDVNRTKAEMLKYENKIQSLNDSDDDRKIRNEHFFLTKKVEETKAEIRQLENNLQFFSNVEDDNPLVQEVHKNINDHKAQLKVWQEKLKKVRSLY
ncbi:DUF349 domain-containing protein [Zunongwangia sp.]|uniref:DUF349 domain-containing protein n=1 Tax=Zunongwangia sp. TaxID=1965325 RepID=UPI003AA873B0